MAQPPMTTDELAKVNAIRTALLAAESALRDAVQATSDLMNIEQAASNAKAKNKAFRFRGTFRKLLGAVEEAHGDASEALDGLVSDAGGVILAPGR